MEKPFNLTMAKLNKVNGKLNRNLPPKANRIARPIDPKKINFLKFFDIFVDGIFATDFNRK